MEKVTQGVVTIANIENFIGKTVDSKRKMFHYYPLTFKKINGKYFYTDKNGVMMPFNDKDKIYFDSIIKTHYKPKPRNRD